MLEKIKQALRISSNAFDSELNDIIESGIQDMKSSGINITRYEQNPLVCRALIIYAKANFGSNPDQVRFQEAYDSAKRFLAIATNEEDGE